MKKRLRQSPFRDESVSKSLEDYISWETALAIVENPFLDFVAEGSMVDAGDVSRDSTERLADHLISAMKAHEPTRREEVDIASGRGYAAIAGRIADICIDVEWHQRVGTRDQYRVIRYAERTRGERDAVSFARDDFGQIRCSSLCRQAREEDSPDAILTKTQRGVAVDHRDEYGRTPILCAAWGGNERNVDVLTDLGADIHAKDKLGAGIVHYAARSGNTNLLTRLKEQYDFDFDAKDRLGRTPLHHAALGGCAKAIAALSDGTLASHRLWERDAAGCTPLHWAAFGGNLETVKWLVESRGSYPGARDRFGTGVLHFAARSGNTSLADYLTGSGSGMRLSCDAQDARGYTPIHDAAANNQGDFILSLRRSNRGATNTGAVDGIDLRNSNGDTPLVEAARHDATEAVRALVVAGANCWEKTDNPSAASWYCRPCHSTGEAVSDMTRALAVARKNGNTKTIDVINGLFLSRGCSRSRLMRTAEGVPPRLFAGEG